MAAVCGLILVLAMGRPALTHAQAVPDAPAPQSDAPAADSPHPSGSTSAPAPAAKKPGEPQPSFPFPGKDDSAAAAGDSPAPTGPDLSKKPQPVQPSKDFPFPDEQGSDAGSTAPPKAPDGAATPDGKAEAPPINPNFSSSATLHDEGSYGMDMPADPKRVKQDQGIAKYYWHLKDWEGAYLRYKDALRFGPENPDTLFGLAEAEAKLGKNVNARKHYEDYLRVAPNGPHARDVSHAISNLPEKDAPAKKGMGPVVP